MISGDALTATLPLWLIGREKRLVGRGQHLVLLESLDGRLGPKFYPSTLNAICTKIWSSASTAIYVENFKNVICAVP
jgi:hypothetical protein